MPEAILKARCQPQLPSLVDQAAQRKGMKPAEYIRRSVVDSLERDGFSVETPMWALVSDDRVLTSWLGDACPDLSDANYHPAGFIPSQDDRWLPIENEDTQPFDLRLHWRLAPHFRVEADRVVRVFPVVPKAEYA